ncbi:hypothetical protein SAMN05421788_11115 [Filimonas lacunae]|uniref:Uncharacterized protein n=1 Tax=Filimonas lacunae TaxID=477680 RepID=A0A173MB82_9BACT|nr:hypothetical protein [Filimonas lacunae]BAV04786.1 hypothetical protein FLA_0785 [Filimonas lacunae]SIT32072.1 hypothetical protein SAMN05421788_11115 [Filimonas lacunae]
MYKWTFYRFIGIALLVIAPLTSSLKVPVSSRLSLSFTCIALAIALFKKANMLYQIKYGEKQKNHNYNNQRTSINLVIIGFSTMAITLIIINLLR